MKLTNPDPSSQISQINRHLRMLTACQPYTGPECTATHKTEQLLLTAPVSITRMVFGKFLAAYVMFAGCVILNTLYTLVLLNYAQLKLAVLFGNLIAILLVGMAFIAIGLFVSALTENQLAAAIGTIAIILVFLLIGLISSLIPSSYPVRYVFSFLSIFFPVVPPFAARDTGNGVNRSQLCARQFLLFHRITYL